MIEHRLDTTHSILHVRPKSVLAKEDFAELARAVDPHIEATGGLAGLIVELDAFPGWDRLGAMVAHIRFVRDHHQRVRKVAVVTDAAWATSPRSWRLTSWRRRSNTSRPATPMPHDSGSMSEDPA